MAGRCAKKKCKGGWDTVERQVYEPDCTFGMWNLPKEKRLKKKSLGGTFEDGQYRQRPQNDHWWCSRLLWKKTINLK